MRPITLNLQIVVNIGNYESLRLGAEWTPDYSSKTLTSGEYQLENAAEMIAADRQLREMASAIIDARKQPTQAAQAIAAKETTASKTNAPQTAKKELLTLAHPQLQKIVKRIESGVKLEKVFEYYDADEQAMNVLRAAARFN